MRRWFSVLGIDYDDARGIGFWLQRVGDWAVLSAHYFPADDATDLSVQNREDW